MDQLDLALKKPDALGRMRAIARAPKASSPPEEFLQASVNLVVERFLCPEWEATASPAGGWRHPAVAALLKLLGVKPGWPDWELVAPGSLWHGLELKREGEGLTGEQPAFARRCAAHGRFYAVADTFETAVAILCGWGALTVSADEVLAWWARPAQQLWRAGFAADVERRRLKSKARRRSKRS